MPEHPALSSDIEQNLPPGYHVVKLIGKGNFGIVYKAKGPGGREWAFKITDMSRGRAVGIKEFKAFRNVRRIKPHRNLIEYYGVWLALANGEFLENAHELSDDDLKKLDLAELIIQMPLAEESLEKRLKKARRDFNKPGRVRQPGEYPGIPLRELLVYMQGVAEALDHLHSPIHPLKSDDDEEGTDWLLHRDVKPGNILIDRTGNVLVADYGVARAVGANVTGTQGGAGTPIYSAPEQLTDHVPDPHPSSDQYSLAITYYELRTGSLPIPDESMSSVEDVKLAQILGRLDFSILPRNEVSVLRKATSKVMKQRYSSCCEFVAELYKANGVAPGRVSGIMPGPAARMPYSDGDILLPPLGEMSSRADSRTPFEMGTMPEIPPALRDPEPPPPPEKQSGPHRVEELVRSTQFTPPATSPPTPVPPPAAPPIAPEPVAKEELPLADEANPWDQPAKPVKGKSTADFAVPPVKGKSTPDLAVPPVKGKSSPDLAVPPVKPKSAPVFELPPDFIDEPKPSPKAPSKTSPKMKAAKEVGPSPYGTAHFGEMPTASPTPKPASNPVIDIDDDEADSKPPTWIPQGQPTKKKISPLVWLAGGAGLAATVAAVIFALKPEPSVADGGGGSPPPPPPPPPITTPLAPSFLADASASLQAAYSSIEIPPPPPPPPPPNITMARELLSGAVKDERIQKENVEQALKLLAEIKKSKDSDSVSKNDAEKLHAAWAKIDAVLSLEKKPLAQAEAILALPKVDLKENDWETWNAVHHGLSRLHPTAAERLTAIRAFLRGDSLISAFGAPAAVLANANVSRPRFAEFKKLADADPSFSNDSTKAVEALDLQWSNAVAMREPGAAKIGEIEKWRKAIRDITLTGEDKAVLEDYHRVRLAGLVQRFALNPGEVDWSDLPSKLPTKVELPGSPWNEWLKAEARVLKGALGDPASRTKVVEKPNIALPDEAYRALVSAELNWSEAESLADKRAAAKALLAVATKKDDSLLVGSRKRAWGAMLVQSGRDLKAKPTAIDSNYAASDEDNALARNCLAEAKRLLEGDADAPSKLKNEVSRNLLLASAFPKTTGKDADLSAISRDHIADAPEAEKNSLWLAFARTRNRATPAGLDDALYAYKKLVDVPSARSVLVADLLDADLQKQFKAGGKASDAVRGLFQPLVNSLFDRRKEKLVAAETKLLADLLAAAAGLAKTEELIVKHAIVEWESKKMLPAEFDAETLKASSDHADVLKAVQRVRKARKSTAEAAKKVKELDESTYALERAIRPLRETETETILSLLDHESLLGHLEMGLAYEAEGQRLQAKKETYKPSYENAIREFKLIADRKASVPAAAVSQLHLSRARCLWETAGSITDPNLDLAAKDLKVVMDRKDDDESEARYWLTLVTVYQNGLLRGSAGNQYEAGKQNMIAPDARFDAAKVDDVISKIQGRPSGRTRFDLELLEWRACAACAKANAANMMSDSNRAALRTAAFKALEDLAGSDEISGAARRILFLSYRLSTAAGRSGDDEVKLPEFQDLFRSPGVWVEQLTKMKTHPSRTEGVARKRLLVDALLALARIRAMPMAALEKKPGWKEVEVLARAALDAAGSDPDLFASVVAKIERLGVDVANAGLDADSATVAGRCFLLENDYPKAAAIVSDQYKTDVNNAGSAWRSLVARKLSEGGDNPKEGDLPGWTKFLDNAIVIDELLGQAIRIVEEKPDQNAKDESDLSSLRKLRAQGRMDRLSKYLDQAIEEQVKADTPESKAKAEEWKAWKAKRLPK